MAHAKSLLLIFSSDAALVARTEALLGAHGWQGRGQTAIAPALEILERLQPAAILVDERDGDAPAMIAAIRQLPIPLNATPLLTAGEEDRGTAGVGRHLDIPLGEEPFRRLLREWSGPLEDHGLRQMPWNFRYRLIRLVGLEAADGMLLRLNAALEEAMEQIAEGAETNTAHRLAGIAGLCGFPGLSHAWSRVDRKEDGALAEAAAASRETMAEIALALGTTDPTPARAEGDDGG